MTVMPHLKLLGNPELTDRSGRAVKLKSRKQLGLLVFLTLEAQTRPVTREKLADLMWPDSEKRRLHSLSQSLTEF